MFAASKSGRVAAAPAATDPFFPYVPLLLNTTSTNGQQNNTFLDSSTNNFTITRNGTPTQGSVTPYWPDGQWSNFFNGSSDYLSAPSTTAFAFGSGVNFTVECWVFLTAYSPGGILGGALVGTTFSASSGWFINSGQDINTLRITSDASGSWGDIITVSAGNGLPLNQWTHIAFVRNGGALTLYKNGVSVGSITGASAYNFTSPGNTAYIGYAQGRYVPGYISNVRIVKGTAVYTGAFTPPTTPLTAITNTTFLTCQSNRFKDNSTNNFAITATGTPRAQAFQPFSPTASYTPAAYGGSGYFNGSTDYLTTPANTAFAFGTGDFTIEAWIYTTARIGSGNYGSLITGVQVYGTSSDWIFCLTSTGLLYFQIGVPSSGAYLSNTAVPLNSWTHVAFSRASGTVKAFINGVDAGNSATYSTSISNNSTPLSVGGPSNGSANGLMQGYISNLRIVKGTAVYTANFTPPTSPVTAITNTSLLTNFTNAGIYDAAVQNNSITVGDAQASTTQSKWSPTSIKFDGTGDYLLMPSATVPALAGAFTIEMWVYFSSISSTNQTLCCKWDTSLFAWLLRASNAGVFFSYGNGVAFTATLSYATTLTSGTWYYLAITRNSSNSVQAYINGSAIGSAQTATGSLNSAANFAVGITPYLTDLPLNGYLQDLRITNGVARTITTPTAAFPTR